MSALGGPLFPYAAHSQDHRYLIVTGYDGTGCATEPITLHECQRCKLWTRDPDGHTAWHRSVDTDQTP